MTTTTNTFSLLFNSFFFCSFFFCFFFFLLRFFFEEKKTMQKKKSKKKSKKKQEKAKTVQEILEILNQHVPGSVTFSSGLSSILRKVEKKRYGWILVEEIEENKQDFHS